MSNDVSRAFFHLLSLLVVSPSSPVVLSFHHLPQSHCSIWPGGSIAIVLGAVVVAVIAVFSLLLLLSL
jgi:hypothetical protein